MNTIKIPGICEQTGESSQKKEEVKKYKLVLDYRDGAISIIESYSGSEPLDKTQFTEIQELTEEEVSILGTEIADHAYDENLDIHCDKCNKFYRPYCRLHPLFQIPDRVVKPDGKSDNKSYSEKTLPILFKIEESKLPNAGLGVVAETFIPVGMVFGPYKGVKVYKKDKFYKDGYAWMIKGRERKFYVDGSHPERSNWLRYINSPRHEAEQNMLAFQTNGKIFYRVIKPIRINEELLVWYGKSYGSEFVGSDSEGGSGGGKPRKSTRNPFIL